MAQTVCWNLTQYGFCRFGKHCRYLHPADSGVLVTDTPKAVAVDASVTSACVVVETTSEGNCKEGSKGKKGGWKGKGKKGGRKKEEKSASNDEEQGEDPLMKAASPGAIVQPVAVRQTRPPVGRPLLKNCWETERERLRKKYANFKWEEDDTPSGKLSLTISVQNSRFVTSDAKKLDALDKQAKVSLVLRVPSNYNPNYEEPQVSAANSFLSFLNNPAQFQGHGKQTLDNVSESLDPLPVLESVSGNGLDTASLRTPPMVLAAAGKLFAQALENGKKEQHRICFALKRLEVTLGEVWDVVSPRMAEETISSEEKLGDDVPWSQDEQTRLEEGLKVILPLKTLSQADKWRAIAGSFVVSRGAKQCAVRFKEVAEKVRLESEKVENNLEKVSSASSSSEGSSEYGSEGSGSSDSEEEDVGADSQNPTLTGNELSPQKTKKLKKSGFPEVTRIESRTAQDIAALGHAVELSGRWEGIATVSALSSRFHLVCQRCSRPRTLETLEEPSGNPTTDALAFRAPCPKCGLAHELHLAPTLAHAHSRVLFHFFAAFCAVVEVSECVLEVKCERCGGLGEGCNPELGLDEEGNNSDDSEEVCSGEAGTLSRPASSLPTTRKQLLRQTKLALQESAESMHRKGIFSHPQKETSCGQNIVSCLRVNGVTPGYRKRANCPQCFAPLNLVIEGFPVEDNISTSRAKQIIEDREAERSSRVRDLAIRIGAKKQQEVLMIKLNTPLPDFGCCKHYRKSFRWFRFPCCGKVHACDECHDANEDHGAEWANRVLCGYCSKEQSIGAISKGKEIICVHCSRSILGNRTTHWEGGKGCRDKKKMDPRDAAKWRGGENKTVSKKRLQRGQKKKK